jgi:LL-diaminopimelate aminotransferase
MVALAKKHETILVCDNAYSEIYYDASEKPVSVLEIEGAKDVAIEFHSLSKTYNMTGWRIGFAVGNPSLIAGLLRAKTNIDSGPLLAVQEAAVFALQISERLVAPLRDVYARRRKIVLDGLREIGIEYFEPKATFFVWAKVPGRRSSMEFTKELIEKQGLVVTPGIGFGEEGEGFFRIALTVPEEKLKEALHRLKNAVKGE